jgi:hypothetical protein
MSESNNGRRGRSASGLLLPVTVGRGRGGTTADHNDNDAATLFNRPRGRRGGGGSGRRLAPPNPVADNSVIVVDELPAVLNMQGADNKLGQFLSQRYLGNG